jgi:thiol-disulfide isomerase/thioredoxin
MFVLIRASLFALALAAVSTGTLAFDLGGNPITQLAPAGAKAVVLFFAASDCPISNRYIPEMQRLAKQYEPAGVRVWFVYPNPGDNSATVRAHNIEFAITAKTALDTMQNLVHLAHATVTPEVAVLVPESGSLRQVYRGRIDDRYLALGTERPQAMHHDLEEAIRAVLAGKPIPSPGGPPIGCSIVALKP